MTGPSRAERESVAAVVTLALVAGAGLAFAYPWITGGVPDDDSLARYVPLHDGLSSVSASYKSYGLFGIWAVTLARAVRGDWHKDRTQTTVFRREPSPS